VKHLFVIFTLFSILLPLSLVAQQTSVVFGRIQNMDQQIIPNANVALTNHTGGTISNKDGTYEISIPANKKIGLTISCIGYEPKNFEVKLAPGERKEINVQLSKATTELGSVEVRDQQLKTNSFNRLDPKTVNLIPTANASIEDLIKTLPGVSSRNELSSQYSVRGGNYDENLVFVNDIEIYRPFLVRAGQQEGLSFLNPDLVSSISFSSGGFEARYGDKMSSVLDIKYKKPTSFGASFDVSLLGANAHVEGVIAKKLSYLVGARYKTNSYFLKGLDTKGDYKPRYFDIQALLNFEISKKWEVSVFGMYSDNSYKLIPQTQETSFSNDYEIYKFTLFFDGQEVDKYQNLMGALSTTFKPNPSLRLKLTASAYQTTESETYDISAEYYLSKVEMTQGSTEGQVPEVLGIGAFINHARNYLDGNVFNVEHRGNYDRKKSQISWGIKYQVENFKNVTNEWQLNDSAGYSLPRPPDFIGDTSHHSQDSLLLSNFVKSNNTINIIRSSGFLQDTWTFQLAEMDISLTAGLRAMYSDFNNQFLLNPRVNLSFKPHWKHQTMFRLSGGYYSQPPSFRELTDLKGNIVLDLKAQTAIQAVAGSDYYFKAWGRPFKFAAEAYYKYIQNLIPYEIDNMKIRYYGTNDAFGYATGIDFRVNGEFVKGVESWASLSIMKTQENINGDWVPRPTDQRINLSIFFQDYIPHYPSWRMNLTLFYGTGLPYGPPNSPKKEQTRRIPAYRRVDIGLSKQIIGETTKFKKSNPFRAFQSLWLSLEVFNLLQFNNTISYLWVTDINNRQFPVPNYLTPRQFNLKLLATF
jgi:hypothetical protein